MIKIQFRKSSVPEGYGTYE